MGDLQLAWRRLRQTPFVSAAIVLSLGLGVGVTTAVFTLVNGLLLRPLPVRDPHRLVTLSSSLALDHGLTTGLGWNLPIWRRLEERADVFGGALAWTSGDIAVDSGPGRQSVYGLYTSGTFFPTLGVQAQIGRLYGVADDVAGGGPDGPVAVISDRFWERRFARDPQAIGSRLVAGDRVVTVVGVTPAGFDGIELGRVFDVAVPLGIEPALRGSGSAVRATNQFLLSFMLRLKPGQSVAAAESAMQTVQKDLLAGIGVPKVAEEPIRLVPAGNGADRSRLRWNYQRPLLAIFIAAALALFVACANIANLMSARAADQAHELSVRMALGAAPARLLRQLLGESLVLGAAGLLAGLAVAWWARHSIAAFLAGSWAIDAGLAIDWRVLGFAAAVVSAAVVMFGVVPAVLAVRSAPADVLKSNDQRIAGTRFATSGLFVIVQVSLSMALVALTGLFVGTFGRLAGLPLGFVGDGVLIADVQIDRRMQAVERIDFVQRLVRAADGVPDVTAVAVSRLTPLSNASNSLWAEQKDVDLRNAITPGWFETYGTPVRIGRDFDSGDVAGSLPVAIVNDAYQRKHFPDRSPIGTVVEEKTIVGVVGDAVFTTVRAGMRPTIYEPLAQASVVPTDRRISVSLRVRSGSPAALGPATATSLSAVPGAANVTVRPLSDDVAASTAQERLLAALSGVFALLALTLSGLGLYGLTSHVVARRRREIGIRIALGATAPIVVRLILIRTATLVLAGVAIGAVAAWWVSTVVESLLYGVGSNDTVTFVAAAVALAVVAIAAAWLPARRATRTNPAETLRMT